MAQSKRHLEPSVDATDVDTDIFDIDDPEAEEAAWREAEADIAAGRFVPHEEVAKWLEAWGKNPDLKMPEEWFN